MPKVSIAVAGHEVTVESESDDLAVVVAAALELHQQTKDPALTRGFGTAGFTGELTSGVVPEDVSLRVGH